MLEPLPTDVVAPMEKLTVVVHEEPRWKRLAVPTAMLALGATCLAASVSLSGPALALR